VTLLQMRTLTWDWLDDVNGAYFTQSTVNLRLNLALWELQKRLILSNKEYFLKCVKTDTVSGQQAYAMPTDLLQIVRLEWYDDGQSANEKSRPILPMTPNQRDLLVNKNGDPQYYTLAKNNIMIWPTPNRVVEIHLEYNYQVSFMVADADVPDVPLMFHEYIPILATRDCLIKDGRPIQPLQAKLDEYERLLKEFAVARQADAPRMVVQSSQDWSW
jgi:hypothetical protein